MPLQMPVPPLPEKFVERLFAELGEADARALCAALDGEPSAAVRMNPFKAREQMYGVFGEPLAWSRWGRMPASRPSFTLDPAFHAGCYYVQEAASQFVGHILASAGVGAGARILDMCAAPGGKTTLYASVAGREGLVVANEPVARRAAVLADNVRKWGTGNVVVTCDVPRSFALSGEKFDVVAVDAPCSGEGMFRKEKASRTEWSAGGVHQCAARQNEILSEAWEALREGGVLIYSTCTFNRTENEEVLQAFAERVGSALCVTDDIACPEAWGVMTGRVGAFRTFRFYPHRTSGEGFFAAAAVKGSAPHGGGTGAGSRRREVLSELTGSARHAVARWFAAPETMRFAVAGDTVYALRAETFDDVKRISSSVNAIYSGVETGRLYGGELKPAHALAMFCDMNRGAVNVAELPREEALGYLRKELFDVTPLAEGMNLVLCDGYALGFAKRIGRRCNNAYPNSLRILHC